MFRFLYTEHCSVCKEDHRVSGGTEKARPARADARRNVDALLEAAKEAFAASGVDAPASS